VSLDLVLLKLVQMRRLLPFAELVARVERMIGGAPAALPAPRPALARAKALFEPAATRPPEPAAPKRPVPSAVLRRPEPPLDDPAPAAPPPAGSAEALILAKMIGLCHERPSLAAPLRSATARLEGDTFLIEVPADFVGFGTMHADEYRDLAKKAAGRSLHLKIASGVAAAPAAAAPEEGSFEKLREDAEKEPAVQEALDLFDGRVVDVREAKTSREDA
jgi:hypothetical protein